VFIVVCVVVDEGVFVFVMIYWNFVDYYGVDWFVVDFVSVGGVGLIMFDFILDEV